jgi:hypothetical protein
MKKKALKKSASVKVVRENRPQALDNWYRYFEAADRRDFRTGFFYFPQLTPSSQLTQMTHRAVIERGEYLYINCAPYRMAINGLALDEVGTGLWPKWITSNPAFNTEVTEAFHQANGDPRIFSLDGRQDFYSAQLAIRIMIPRYGDCFGQFMRAGAGNGYGSNMPGLHLIPGYLCENSGKEASEAAWIRGILPDRFSRALKYRFLDSENSDGYHDEDAQDVLHFFDTMVPGELRGQPVATSIAKKMFRFEDVKRAIHNGTLAREMLGYVIEMDGDSGPGPLVKMPGARVIEERTVAKGADDTTGNTTDKKAESRFTVQKFFGHDTQDSIVVPELRNGAKIRMLESQRPGTQSMEMLDSILRELAWARGYAPEYVFFIASGKQGTALRLLLQKTNAVIKGRRAFQLVPQFLNRYPTFWVWNALIKTRRVKAEIPDDWYKTKIGSDADMTVDIGREGKLYDERVSTGKMSISRYHALSGEDDEDVEDENLKIVERRMKKLEKLNKRLGSNFTYFDLWPRTPTSGGSDIQSGAQAPDPDGDPES